MICSIWWNGQRDSPGATAMWECLESQTYLERLFVAANSQTLGARQRRSYNGVIKNFMHVHYNEPVAADLHRAPPTRVASGIQSPGEDLHKTRMYASHCYRQAVLGGHGRADIELQLDATITALDSGWIAVLYDVPPEGEPFP
jgi:hypothetical protein